MNRSSRWSLTSAVVAVGLASALVACHDSSGPRVVQTVSPFVETNFVADAAAGGAAITDANLTNPWGIVFNTTTSLWVANNYSGTSTVYNDSTGTKSALTVTIPSHAGATGGKPTGIVFNATTGFVIPGGVAAKFIFADSDGTIAAWSSGATAVIVADRSSIGAVYKGLAIWTNGTAKFLYATDFRHNAVNVFDSSYTYVKSFTDSTMAAGYAPFGIQNIGGNLYVTFAKRLAPDSVLDQAGAGNGFVDVFNFDGSLAKHFASNGSLNSPWGMALAPTGFGAFGGDILVGNFGDGRIGAYSAANGSFAGFVGDTTSTPLAIDGLWGLTFGNGQFAGKLFFSAGPSGGLHGLLGTLTPKP
jgi:uncharacterized protein (TIGR03118 family)